MEAPFNPSGASRTWSSPAPCLAPIAASASRCVEIERRAGKSPPGGARCARPTRASNGPSRRTEPRSRPTSARSGAWLRTRAARTRSVVLPMPSTSAAQIQQQPCHDLYIANARDVRQDALVRRQQARREQRERGVLVPLHGHASLQPAPAFNHECRHLLEPPPEPFGGPLRSHPTAQACAAAAPRWSGPQSRAQQLNVGRS